MTDENKNPTYEEAVTVEKARTAGANSNEPKPDHPYMVDLTADGAGHVNPALTPAPAYKAPVDRVPVPVVNDPGILGANPDLADLNRAYRSHDMARAADREGDVGDGPKIDDTGGVTEQSNLDAIRNAAQARLDRLKDDKAKASSAPVSQSEPSKFGSASA